MNLKFIDLHLQNKLQLLEYFFFFLRIIAKFENITPMKLNNKIVIHIRREKKKPLWFHIAENNSKNIKKNKKIETHNTSKKVSGNNIIIL